MNKRIVQNIAFFDAEFTALSDKDRGVQEMIQCAFLVHQAEISDSNKLVDIAEEPIFTYFTFIKPTYNQQLSDYIKGLTGITQEDVDNGKDFCDVIDDICAAVRKYGIKKIFTWGPDRQMLKGNCNVINCNLLNAKAIYNKFDDVSKKMSDICGYHNVISQHKMCQQFGIDEIGEKHNAYYDAMNLSKIIKEFCGQCSL